MKQKSMDGTEHIYFYLKDEEYGWMSNFYPSVLAKDGFLYPTNEHYYQAHKTSNPDIKRWIIMSPKPYLAMRAGRSLREKDGFYRRVWEDVKVGIMLEGLRQKFGKFHPELRQKLLNTGNAILHEDSPTDKFWGIKGKDQLGKCLMQIREEIRNER